MLQPAGDYAPQLQSRPPAEPNSHALVDVSDLQPRMLRYYVDLTASAASGWCLLFLAATVPLPWSVLICALSVVPLYRAFMFLHELTHLRARQSRPLSVLWNAICGVPLLCPSFMYVGVHLIHHAPKYYGSDRDHEYVELGDRPRLSATAYVVGATAAPLLLSARALLLVPGGWFSRRIRSFKLRHASALVMRPGHTRTARDIAHTPLWRIWETATFVVAVFLVWSALVGSYAFPLLLLGAATGIAFLNAWVSIVLHGYHGFGPGHVNRLHQADDTREIGPNAVLVLVAPLGLTAHATHHIFPSVPYHSLGEARARLRRARAVP